MLRTALPVGTALVAAAAVGVVAAVDPNEPGHYPTCPFLALTGLFCPGCGTLRALHAVAHGDPATALARNPFAVVAAVAMAAIWLGWLQRSVTGRQRRVAPGWLIWSVLGGIVAFWVLRNLPGFEWLAP